MGFLHETKASEYCLMNLIYKEENWLQHWLWIDPTSRAGNWLGILLTRKAGLFPNHPFIESSKVEAWSLLRLTS